MSRQQETAVQAKRNEIIFNGKVAWTPSAIAVLFCRFTYQSLMGFGQVGQCTELFGSFYSLFSVKHEQQQAHVSFQIRVARRN